MLWSGEDNDAITEGLLSSQDVMACDSDEEKTADINVAHVAAAIGHLESLQKMAQAGDPMITAADKDGFTILDYALARERIDVVRYILEENLVPIGDSMIPRVLPSFAYAFTMTDAIADVLLEQGFVLTGKHLFQLSHDYNRFKEYSSAVVRRSRPIRSQVLHDNPAMTDLNMPFVLTSLIAEYDDDNYKRSIQAYWRNAVFMKAPLTLISSSVEFVDSRPQTIDELCEAVDRFQSA